MKGISVVRVRHNIKRWFERLTGCHVFRRLPHGCDLFVDISRVKPDVDVVVDVGANVGQSALRFREEFSRAQIYCLEPVAATFDLLRQNVGHLGCRCYRLAAGSRKESREIFVGGNSFVSSLRKAEFHTEKEDVSVVTLDEWTAEEGIQRIDVLKIDTEGHDLEVLAGATRLLNAGAIQAIVAEVGFDPAKSFVLFEDVARVLRPHGLVPLGLYHQTPDWSGRHRLLYADALFLKDE